MAGPQVLIVRDFDAPRELVYGAWTTQEQLLCWFAPRGCRVNFRKFDFRVGGEFHSCIHTPDGRECWCKGTYRRIVEPELIEFSMVISNAAMQTLEPIEADMDPEWPKETIVTVTLADHQGGTRLTLRQTVDEALAKRTGAYPSWLDMLDQLAERLTTR
jgi:uncharacterized protein YndB with AHSA1/START domain